MSDIDNDEVLIQDEMTTLKARADMLGIKYHPSIGLDKLREKVNAAITGGPAPTPDADPEPEIPTVEAAPVKETETQRLIRMRREANELIRIRVTCMNPAKSEWEGEIFTVGNRAVGTIKKFVPFNVEEGWHVPKMIYDVMKDRQCQVFYTAKDERGNKTRKGKLIKEFAIEVLPQLTQEELHDLAQRQAMAKSID